MTVRRPTANAAPLGVQSLPPGMRATRATKALLALVDAQPGMHWSAAEVQAAASRTLEMLGEASPPWTRWFSTRPEP